MRREKPPTGRRRCLKCDRPFRPQSRWNRFCPDCAKEQDRIHSSIPIFRVDYAVLEFFRSLGEEEEFQ